jgi:hypothetical protein
VSSYEPRVVVIAGGEEQDDDVARWAYRVRASAGALPVLLFRRAGAGRSRTTGARHLAGSPTQAARQLVELADAAVRHVVEEAPLEFDDGGVSSAPRRRRLTA